MKKGKIVSFLSALVLLATAAVFSVACAAERERCNNIEVNGSIYIEGEQTIYVSGTTSAMGDAPAVFHSDITVADITLGGAVAGKTIESVSFVSSDEIRIVPYGSFTDYATVENIALVNPTNGVLSEVEVSEGKLSVTVEQYDPTKGETYPLVRIPANATTFNVEIEAYVGMILSSYPLT